jgi:hypothetical protein
VGQTGSPIMHWKDSAKSTMPPAITWRGLRGLAGARVRALLTMQLCTCKGECREVTGQHVVCKCPCVEAREFIGWGIAARMLIVSGACSVYRW